MKKTIFLFILLLSTGCVFFEQTNYRHCVYNEKDGLYYDWIEKIPCTHLNKKLEKERK